MDLGSCRAAAVAATLEAGAAAGYRGARPVVLQDTNNVVVWLRPHDVVAKAGIWAHSAEVLRREVDVCAHLRRAGAPVATPLGSLRLVGPAPTPVSLWVRLEPVASPAVGDADLVALLTSVHEGLRGYGAPLPSWRVAIEHARAVLFDDDRMQAMRPSDLGLLRRAFAGWADRAGAWSGAPVALHGEPHGGNIVATRGGPVLLDFEGASTGPREWDLAFLPPGAADAFTVDRELLTLLRNLNRARVATWGWTQADHPVMRAHGEHHLAAVRHALTARPRDAGRPPATRWPDRPAPA